MTSFGRHIAESVLGELDLGLSLLDIAELSRSGESRLDTLQAALRAYERAEKLMAFATLSQVESVELATKFNLLKLRLEESNAS